MKPQCTRNRIIAGLLLAVFASFVCGNTLFTHTHRDGDRVYVHSHATIPGTHHSHSPQAMASIGSINAALAQMIGTGIATVPDPGIITVVTGYAGIVVKVCCRIFISGLRAPPAEN